MSRYSALWDKNGFSHFAELRKKILAIPSTEIIYITFLIGPTIAMLSRTSKTYCIRNSLGYLGHYE